ncbi:MAG: HlyC/CorC family transporter [Gammaproteobacteria bacterium]|nr:HlyC/CorC family transporter [Gammaproteobacteria bacterium]
MADISPGVLVGALVFLIVLSAFFSAAEIGLMTLNRYRLRHLAESGHRGARLASRLLERPDRLLGLILLGNNFANITASSVATLLAFELYGEKAIAIAAGLLTFVILVFAEVAPKTLAALNPERVAFPVAYVLAPLLRLLYPLVWLTNILANLFLRAFGVSVHRQRSHEVTAEELRALVREANVLIPASHQDMLLAILDLEKVTVDEVMVPRNRIEGVDVNADWDDIVRQLTGGRYTRLPAYRGSLDNVVGIVHIRRVLNLMHENRLDRTAFDQLIVEPYFIPAGTPLNTQLLNFKQVKRRLGLVVDEYGDIQGLVTLDMILEEIVGDFTTRALGQIEDVHPAPDGSFLVRGSVSLRDLNRQLGWELPTEASHTLNGLILEYLEDIPAPGTSLMVGGYAVEILRTRGTAIELARVRPAAAEGVTEPAS